MNQSLLIALTTLAFAGNVSAAITTKKQADAFMEQYCISLVDRFEKYLEKAKDVDPEENLMGFIMAREEIDRFAELYNKLCK